MNYQANDHYKHSHTIAFVDLAVVENLDFIANINSGTELIFIDPIRDGIKQITAILASRNNIKSLQIISSAKDNKGSLTIGSTQLNIHNLETYIDDLQQWQNALAANPEILIYGCLVLVESLFQNFIYQLAKITKADIGAFVTFPDSITANNHDIDRYSLMVAWRS